MKQTLTPKISIIIPVYNAEKYLESCLNSLLAQSMSDIEIICINDGSSDSSQKILETYAKLHNKIKFFNQENSGPAKARNMGLEKSTAEFIMFCDADDTYCPTMCQKMYDAINNKNTDLVMCNTNGYDRNGKIVYNNYYFSLKEGRYSLSQNIIPKINVFLWNKIFRKSKIDLHKINFPNGHKSDDNYFVFTYLTVSNDIYCLDERLYNHFDRENSIMDLYRTSGLKYEDVKDKADILELLYDFMKQNSVFEKNNAAFQDIFYNELFYAWINVPDEWIKQFLSRIKEVLIKISYNFRNDDFRINLLYDYILSEKFDEAAAALDFLLASRKRKRRKYAIQKDISPAFDNRNIPIIFNSDDNFVKYLSVAIQSVIKHSSDNRNYDLIILNQDISKQNQELLLSMVTNYKNFSIRFYNMDNYVYQYNVQDWFTTNHIKSAAYYRLFIPDILKNYDKAIYFDADLIATTDIAALYDISLDGNACAAVKDNYISLITQNNEFVFLNFASYAKDILKMPDLSGYFNSGVIVFNIKKINEQHTLKDFINVAQKNNKYFHDQNVLNSVFNGNIKYLDATWNCQINSGKDFISEITLTSLQKINIIHFCSKFKPWLFNIPYANIWWKYAKASPYYEMILSDYLKKNVFDGKQLFDADTIKLLASSYTIKYRYWKYKILSHIFFGQKRKKYKDKKRRLKTDIKMLHNILGR